MNVWSDILQIVYNELGEKTGKVYEEFYDGSPIEDQFNAAFDIFKLIFGEAKAKDLLKDIKDKI